MPQEPPNPHRTGPAETVRQGPALEAIRGMRPPARIAKDCWHPPTAATEPNENQGPGTQGHTLGA